MITVIVLRFTPPAPENGIGRYFAKDDRPRYFLRLGLQWPKDPSKRLIDATCLDPKEAREFKNEEEAREILCVAGNPSGWTIAEV